MPLPLAVAAVGTALWSAGRWALMRAAPVVASKVGGLLGRKLSVGSAVAVNAAMVGGIPAAAWVDGKLDHAASEFLLDTPAGPAVEAILKVGEWSNSAKASVVSNAIKTKLNEHDLLDEDAPDYERSKKLVDVMGHVIIGDMIGAATLAAEIGVDPSDIAAAYNKAREENPDATLHDIGGMTFENVREQLLEADRKKEREAERHAEASPEKPEPEAKKRPVPEQPQPRSWLDDSGIDENGLDLAGTFTRVSEKARDIAARSGQSLGLQFNLMAGLTMFVNFINGLTGGMLDGVANSLNKAMIDMAKTRVQEMTRGETVSTGNLNMDGKTPAPEPLRPSGQAPELAPQ